MAKYVRSDWTRPTVTKKSSGSGIKQWYLDWYEHVVEPAEVIRLDEQRAFPQDMKQAIWERTSGVCGVCSKAVKFEDAEFDHYPVPYRLGGKTEIPNERPVHPACHARGRPRSDEEQMLDELTDDDFI
jgi:hypothetical protein